MVFQHRIHSLFWGTLDATLATPTPITHCRHAAIGGGYGCTATGEYSVVVGGSQSQAVGNYSVALGGQTNYAGGELSLAAGRLAYAVHDGSAVFNFQDTSFTAKPCLSAGAGTVNFCHANGIFSNGDLVATHVALEDNFTSLQAQLDSLGSGSGSGSSGSSGSGTTTNVNVTELEARLDAQNKTLSTLEGVVEWTRDGVERNNASVVTAQQDLRLLSSNVTSLERQMQRLDVDLTLANDTASLAKQLALLQNATLASLQTEVADHATELQTLDESTATARTDLDSVVGNVLDLTARVEALEGKFAVVNSTVYRLGSDLYSERARTTELEGVVALQSSTIEAPETQFHESQAQQNSTIDALALSVATLTANLTALTKAFLAAGHEVSFTTATTGCESASDGEEEDLGMPCSSATTISLDTLSTFPQTQPPVPIPTPIPTTATEAARTTATKLNPATATQPQRQSANANATTNTTMMVPETTASASEEVLESTFGTPSIIFSVTDGKSLSVEAVTSRRHLLLRQ